MALTEKEKKQEEMNVKNETASANNTATGNSLKGVDEATTQKMNSTFTASDNQVNAQNNANSALTNLGNLTNKDKLVSDKTYDILGSSFQKPESVKAADKWIANQLSVIQSGKTSYTDQVKNMMDKISGREKFSYDVDSDPLFQQALASAMAERATSPPGY